MKTAKCPACQGIRIITGSMNGQRWDPALTFKPGYSRYMVRGRDGVTKLGGPIFRCCMSCGLVWSGVDPQQLREFVEAHGDELTKQDAGLAPPDPFIDLSVSSPGRAMLSGMLTRSTSSSGRTSIRKRS